MRTSYGGTSTWTQRTVYIQVSTYNFASFLQAGTIAISKTNILSTTRNGMLARSVPGALRSVLGFDGQHQGGGCTIEQESRPFPRRLTCMSFGTYPASTAAREAPTGRAETEKNVSSNKELRNRPIDDVSNSRREYIASLAETSIVAECSNLTTDRQTLTLPYATPQYATRSPALQTW